MPRDRLPPPAWEIERRRESAQWLAEELGAAGMAVAELARRCGVGRCTAYQWLQPSRGVPISRVDQVQAVLREVAP